ncbi:MAG: hypothetical protein JWM46_662 [Candidatus Kaiserbacteria bacterium]|nr:hypothetical protein [Candidatus Kaiserbacteria bacterium]
MALNDLLKAELFKTATLNLGFRSRNEDWEPSALRESAAALREIARLAPQHADAMSDKLTEVVDKVMLSFYPHHGRWTDPELCEFLIKKAEMLETVAGNKPVARPDLIALDEFCKEMWINLSAFEMKQIRDK